MNWKRLIAVAAVAVAFATSAWAQQKPPQGGQPRPPGQAQPRQPDKPDVQQRRADLPMNAVGLLSMDDGICTGTVIGPRHVLTAAHCLFHDDDTPVRSIRFRAGYEHGRTVVEARGVDRITPRNFTRKRHSSSHDIDGLDWAIVILDREIGGQTGIVRVRALANREMSDLIRRRRLTIVQIGYGHSGGRYQHVIDNCQVEFTFEDDTYAHDCGTIPGDSGSPNLMREENGQYVVIGVESAELTAAGRVGLDMVVSATAFARAVDEALRRPAPSAPRAPSGKPS
jgi:protease YdgD